MVYALRVARLLYVHFVDLVAGGEGVATGGERDGAAEEREAGHRGFEHRFHPVGTEGDQAGADFHERRYAVAVRESLERRQLDEGIGLQLRIAREDFVAQGLDGADEQEGQVLAAGGRDFRPAIEDELGHRRGRIGARSRGLAGKLVFPPAERVELAVERLREALHGVTIVLRQRHPTAFEEDVGSGLRREVFPRPDEDLLDVGGTEEGPGRGGVWRSLSGRGRPRSGRRRGRI